MAESVFWQKDRPLESTLAGEGEPQQQVVVDLHKLICNFIKSLACTQSQQRGARALTERKLWPGMGRDGCSTGWICARQPKQKLNKTFVCPHREEAAAENC